MLIALRGHFPKGFNRFETLLVAWKPVGNCRCHPVGAEKLNLNVRAVGEILGINKRRNGFARRDAANDV